MSYLGYLCLVTYGGVQHILCCVFVVFVFVLCTICCQFLWIVLF
jgi:NhaP-type Na+/H+ or K+/H+ antiporter